MKLRHNFQFFNALQYRFVLNSTFTQPYENVCSRPTHCLLATHRLQVLDAQVCDAAALA